MKNSTDPRGAQHRGSIMRMVRSKPHQSGRRRGHGRGCRHGPRRGRCRQRVQTPHHPRRQQPGTDRGQHAPPWSPCRRPRRPSIRWPRTRRSRFPPPASPSAPADRRWPPSRLDWPPCATTRAPRPTSTTTPCTTPVVAFQKVNGLPRTGKVTTEVAAAMATAPLPTAVLPAAEPNRVEIDLTRQVLLYWQDGKLVRILPVSSGFGGHYCGDDGSCGIATTPDGCLPGHEQDPGDAQVPPRPALGSGVLQRRHRHPRRAVGARPPRHRTAASASR